MNGESPDLVTLAWAIKVTPIRGYMERIQAHLATT